jgi:hypothetical protein
MPVDYAQDATTRRVTLTARGTVTLTELLELSRHQANAGAWQYGTLYDGRLRDQGLSASDVRTYAAFARAQSVIYGRMGPLAIVAPALDAYGNGRMYALSNDDDHRLIEVFHDMADAIRWLEAQAAPLV